MGFSSSDVVPFTQARANLSELADQVKAWQFSRSERDSAGTAVLEYRIRLRKSVPGTALAGELRARLGPRATGVETR